MRRQRIRLVVCIVAVFAGPASANWPADGVPVCAYPECLGDRPNLMADGTGGAYILWSWRHHRITRLLGSGDIAPGWPIGGTIVGRDAIQAYGGTMASDGSGGAYVAWNEWPDQNVFLQHYLPNGQTAPGWPAEGLLVCGLPGDQSAPALTTDGAGGVIMVWEDGRRTGGQIEDLYGMHIQSDGTRAAGWPVEGLPISVAPLSQYLPSIISDGEGGAFITWSDSRTLPNDIYLLRINGDGTLPPGWVADGNLIWDGPRYDVTNALVSDGAGGVYLLRGDNTGYQAPLPPDADLYLHHIDGQGAVSPGWPPTGITISAEPDLQYAGVMTPDEVGGVLISWISKNPSRPGVFAARILSDGSRAAGWPLQGRLVHSQAGSPGGVLDASPDGLNGAYFSHHRGNNPERVYLQHFAADGEMPAGWSEGGLAVSNNTQRQLDGKITADGMGGSIVAWHDGDGRVYAQKFGSDGPTATLLSLVSIDAEPDRVLLSWHGSAVNAAEATIYRRTESVGWLPIGLAAFDGSGVLSFEDRSISAGRRYAYRLGLREAGAEVFSEETWIDIPAALQLSLEGLRPNPASDRVHASFTLPRAERATLELLDVSGRIVQQREVGDLGPGRHLIAMGKASDLAAGLYWLRLVTEDRTLVTRATILR